MQKCQQYLQLLLIMIKGIAVSLVNASTSRAIRGLVKTSCKESSDGENFPAANRLKMRFGTNSWFYKSYLSSMNEGTSLKNSKLVFRTQSINFLPFFMHPSVSPTENPSIHLIKANNVLLLSYVLQTEAEFAKQAWDNRKTIGLNFRQTLKILNVKPGLNKHETIIKEIKTQDFIQKKILQIEDISDSRRVQIRLKCFDPSKMAEQQMAKWQVAISLSYEEYLTFLQNIKSNILYISGCSFQIEYSKSRNMAIAQQKSQRYYEDSKNSSKGPKKQYKYLTKEKK